MRRNAQIEISSQGDGMVASSTLSGAVAQLFPSS